MSIQDELRRIAGLRNFALYRARLLAAARKIYELEREVERLRAAQQEGK